MSISGSVTRSERMQETDKNNRINFILRMIFYINVFFFFYFFKYCNLYVQFFFVCLSFSCSSIHFI